MVKALWAFFLLGLALFFFYDVLRFWRSVWGSRRATFLADVLWWLVAAFSCYTLFLAYTDGVIRALCQWYAAVVLPVDILRWAR